MKPVCETCGGENWKNTLATCAKCHIAYEHCYCLRKLSFTASVHFVCDDCSMVPVKENLTLDSDKEVNIRKKVRVESSNPVPKWKKIPETSKMKLISPEEARKLSYGGKKSTFKVPKQTAYVPKTMSLNAEIMTRNTKPCSPRPSQVLSGVIRRDSQAHAVAEGSKSKFGDGYIYSGSGEISRSILSETLLQLLAYQPALYPIWKGCIVDSATPSEFSGEFLAQPAFTIRGKAFKLSKAIPTLLKVQLVPIHNILNDLFVNRIPELSDIDIYIFQDDKNSQRSKEEHDHLFEAMRTQNAMIRININETPLLIFSSKLLDKSSQLFIKMQKQTNNFLWGIFLLTKKSLALVPGTSNQTIQLHDGDVLETAIKPQFRHSNHQDSGKNLQRCFTERK